MNIYVSNLGSNLRDEELNGTTAGGRALNVSEARPKDEGSSNRGGFNKRW